MILPVLMLSEGEHMKRKWIFVLLALLFVFGLSQYHEGRAFTTHLRVAFNRHQAPYHFLDETGQAIGLHIDMLESIAGSADFQIEYFPMENGSDCLDALERGEVDLVLDITQKFSGSKWVTDALSEETVCTVALSDADTNYDRPVVSIQVGAVTPKISFHLNAARSVIVSNPRLALDYLISGKVDLAVILKESALYHLAELEETEVYSIKNNYLGMVSFSLRVPDNDYQLLHILNREINALRASNEYTEMRERWSYQTVDNGESLIWLKRLVTILVIVVVVVGIYAITVTIVRRALRLQVEKQTVALQEANTEIRRQMEQLEAESDIRNRIIRYSHLGMVLFDEQYKIQLVNDSALFMSGEKSPLPDIRQLPVFGDIVRTCSEGAVFQIPDLEGAQTLSLNQSNQERRYRYNFQQVQSQDHAGVILLVVEDITKEEAQRNARFEEEKSRTLNQVVAGIAHEIKNPLTSIKAFAAALHDECDNPHFMEDFVCYVPSEVDRINRLVEGLIGYAKPAKGTPGYIDLSALVWETVFFARNMSPAKQVEISCEIEGGHMIYGIQDQIKQILINIIINGMESMKEKLAVCSPDRDLFLHISLREMDNCSCITVRDEGVGMSQEAIERCMDPFFTTKRTGTGLGLTLCKQYARENNGRLQITSEVGQYTEIQITFRREKHEA